MGDTEKPPTDHIEEYKILVDLLKNQHTRYSDFCNMSLVIHTAWIALIGGSLQYWPDKPLVSFLLPGMGAMFCVVWYFTLKRLRLDDERLLLQLRDLEERYKFSRIFSDGYDFYVDEKKRVLESKFLPRREGCNPLKHPSGCCSWFRGGFPAHKAGLYWSGLFFVFYLLLVLLLISGYMNRRSLVTVIAHSKAMVVDGRVVITGSYNFTKAAEESNAENRLVIRDADLAAKSRGTGRSI